MWTLSENQNGTWTAQNYTMTLVNGKPVKAIKSAVTGTERQALDFMLSFEEVGLKDLQIALKTLIETGDDTAHFGVLGGFMWTSVENQAGVA